MDLIQQIIEGAAENGVVMGAAEFSFLAEKRITHLAARTTLDRDRCLLDATRFCRRREKCGETDVLELLQLSLNRNAMDLCAFLAKAIFPLRVIDDIGQMNTGLILLTLLA